MSANDNDAPVSEAEYSRRLTVDFLEHGLGQGTEEHDFGGRAGRQLIVAKLPLSRPAAVLASINRIVATEMLERFKNKLVGMFVTTLCRDDLRAADGPLPRAHGANSLDAAVRYYHPEPRRRPEDDQILMYLANRVLEPEQTQGYLQAFWQLLQDGAAASAPPSHNAPAP